MKFWLLRKMWTQPHHWAVVSEAWGTPTVYTVLPPNVPRETTGKWPQGGHHPTLRWSGSVLLIYHSPIKTKPWNLSRLKSSCQLIQRIAETSFLCQKKAVTNLSHVYTMISLPHSLRSEWRNQVHMPGPGVGRHLSHSRSCCPSDRSHQTVLGLLCPICLAADDWLQVCKLKPG